MIVNLDPIEKIFDKVIVDLNITEHDVDPRAFNMWAMEAMEHIGGLNRVEALNQLLDSGTTLTVTLIDHRALFPNGVLNLNEVRYFAPVAVGVEQKRDDYVLCYPANGKYMDDADTVVYFDREYLVEEKKRTTLSLYLNRKEGRIQALGCRLPQMKDSKTGNIVGLFIPSLASYQEAVYWYICMKMLWRDVYRGRNKGNQHSYAAGMWNNLKNTAYGDLMMPDRWEVDDLADELSLSISYTGLNKRRSSFGRDNEIPTVFDGRYPKQPIKPLIP